MAKFDVTGEQYFGLTGQMLEIHRQIRLKSGSPINPELIALALQDIIEGRFVHISKKENSITRLLSKGESILIDACDGKETLADAKDVFKSDIDSDFKNWNTNKPSNNTEETAVQVHEIVENSTFVQMFGSFGTDLDKLCLTQSQIKNFCKKHSKWLRADGYATLFLFKVDNQFFVVSVCMDSGGLSVYVDHFNKDYVWSADATHRLVFPQQTV
jgi:hypothetical protein